MNEIVVKDESKFDDQLKTCLALLDVSFFFLHLTFLSFSPVPLDLSHQLTTLLTFRTGRRPPLHHAHRHFTKVGSSRCQVGGRSQETALQDEWGGVEAVPFAHGRYDGRD